MVVKKRLRRFILPVLMHSLIGGAALYFSWHAYNGHRGLAAKIDYKQKVAKLNGEIAVVAAERQTWELRVKNLQREAVDRDLLEERARFVLNSAHRNDLVVIFDEKH